ncbi:secreted protein [Phakopsora pachyrhizi]|uniref:Secreted protein n=1 Tax=Phakopsora pachyrhizi TaxID=170000 RepID=A0A0S1MK82_PHAPC|nr:secreted protein [Phakopsora pachyrhizi]CAH7686458.1 secreted protein [Phakopsora pachyrhizi]
MTQSIPSFSTFSKLLATLILLSTSTLFQLSLARVDLGGGHMGLAMTHTCKDPNTVSCTELDDDWPDLGLACPVAHHDIPKHTLGMMSATLIQLGRYKEVNKKDFPIDECYTTAPNSTVSSYGFISQGTFDMWFFAHDKCNCKPRVIPVCNDRATEDDKCNLRTFTLCKVTKKTEICSPKHHEGWQPISKSKQKQSDANTSTDKLNNDDQETDLSIGEKYMFDPKYRKQTAFNSLTGSWWRLMEILGVWGAI